MRVLLILLTTSSIVSAAVIHRDLGHANGFDIKANGETVSVYAPETKSTRVFLTHHRRDLYSNLSNRIVAPSAERAHFEKTHEYWTGMATKRFQSS